MDNKFFPSFHNGESGDFVKESGDFVKDLWNAAYPEFQSIRCPIVNGIILDDIKEVGVSEAVALPHWAPPPTRTRTISSPSVTRRMSAL